MATERIHGLTPKQERFCLAYIETGNASNAYRQSYAVGDQTKPSTVWCSASQMLRNPSVGHRIAELRSRHADRHEVTIDAVTEQLRRAYELAMARGQPSAAVGASMAMAKLHGLFKKPAEAEARNFVINAEPMTEEEWEHKYGQPLDQRSREIVECETA